MLDNIIRFNKKSDKLHVNMNWKELWFHLTEAQFLRNEEGIGIINGLVIKFLAGPPSNNKQDDDDTKIPREKKNRMHNLTLLMNLVCNEYMTISYHKISNTYNLCFYFHRIFVFDCMISRCMLSYFDCRWNFFDFSCYFQSFYLIKSPTSGIFQEKFSTPRKHLYFSLFCRYISAFYATYNFSYDIDRIFLRKISNCSNKQIRHSFVLNKIDKPTL